MSSETPAQFKEKAEAFLQEYRSSESADLLLEYEASTLLALYSSLTASAESLTHDSELVRDAASKVKKFTTHKEIAAEWRKQAHLQEVTAIGIRSLLQAIMAVEKGVSKKQLDLATTRAKTYKLVKEVEEGKEKKIILSEDLVVDRILDEVRTNDLLEFVIITGQPGAGKSRLISILSTRLIQMGVVPVRNSFDQIIDAFFRLEQTPTAQWNDRVARDFDERSDEISSLVHKYYPLSYANKGMRELELSDTLGYKARKMKYGLYSIDKRRDEINQGKGLVVSIIGERVVVFGSSGYTRSQEVIDPSDSQQTTQVLSQGGAPVPAIISHDKAVRIQTSRAFRTKEMKKIRKAVSFTDQLPPDYPVFERAELEDKVALMKFLAHNHGISPQQWLCAVNFYATGSLSQGDELD